MLDTVRSAITPNNRKGFEPLVSHVQQHVHQNGEVFDCRYQQPPPCPRLGKTRPKIFVREVLRRQSSGIITRDYRGLVFRRSDRKSFGTMLHVIDLGIAGGRGTGKGNIGLGPLPSRCSCFFLSYSNFRSAAALFSDSKFASYSSQSSDHSLAALTSFAESI